MPTQIARHLTAAGGMADMDGVFQVEMRRKSRQVVGVMVHIVALGGLGGATVATAVMGDHAVAMMQEEQQLRVPIIRRQRPAMAEHDWLARSPILEVDFRSVFRSDRRHDVHSFSVICRVCRSVNYFQRSGILPILLDRVPEPSKRRRRPSTSKAVRNSRLPGIFAAFAGGRPDEWQPSSPNPALVWQRGRCSRACVGIVSMICQSRSFDSFMLSPL